MSETVSIVIPTFNRAGMLPVAIDSALNQTKACEVIVVDHGSTDDTPKVAEAYGDRILYIRRERDFGPHFCWLEGALHASGEFVHLQYDDDWIAPTFIEACLAVITPETGFAFSGADVTDGPGLPTKLRQFMDWLPATGTYPVDAIERQILGSLISPGAALYRRQILIDALYPGRLPLQINEYRGVGPDAFVSLLSMLRYPAVGYVREPLAFFRFHEGSITIDAFASGEKTARLRAAYAEVTRHYLEMKVMRAVRIREAS
ncbi:glycosyltransferase family 2 protein [Rhizobium sp. CF142]|uniref:glycosyltransferase family 2 protein n=1 Tax=Rhizobium sp. CF142 TaxID=1144314 RepID=UPI00026F0039|nr:glycosyltransferase family 2 protein [Rhizobium sp. CF142]EJJ30959.1 glycosyl transferase [Rhizobium sp. CF142]